MGGSEASKTQVQPSREDPREQEIRLLKAQLGQMTVDRDDKASLADSWREKYERLEERVKNTVFDRWINRFFKVVARILWLLVSLAFLLYPLARWWYGRALASNDNTAGIILTGLCLLGLFVAHALYWSE